MWKRLLALGDNDLIINTSRKQTLRLCGKGTHFSAINCTGHAWMITRTWSYNNLQHTPTLSFDPCSC